MGAYDYLLLLFTRKKFCARRVARVTGGQFSPCVGHEIGLEQNAMGVVRMLVKRQILVGEKGRAGQDHHAARLSDEEVEEMRTLYEDGLGTYSTLAKRFGVAKSTVAYICQYARRNAIPRTITVVVKQAGQA